MAYFRFSRRPNGPRYSFGFHERGKELWTTTFLNYFYRREVDYSISILVLYSPLPRHSIVYVVLGIDVFWFYLIPGVVYVLFTFVLYCLQVIIMTFYLFLRT